MSEDGEPRSRLRFPRPQHCARPSRTHPAPAQRCSAHIVVLSTRPGSPNRRGLCHFRAIARGWESPGRARWLRSAEGRAPIVFVPNLDPAGSFLASPGARRREGARSPEAARPTRSSTRQTASSAETRSLQDVPLRILCGVRIRRTHTDPHSMNSIQFSGRARLGRRRRAHRAATRRLRATPCDTTIRGATRKDPERDSGESRGFDVTTRTIRGHNKLPRTYLATIQCML